MFSFFNKKKENVAPKGYKVVKVEDEDGIITSTLKPTLSTKVRTFFADAKAKKEAFLKKHKVIDRIYRILTAPFKAYRALVFRLWDYNEDLAGIFLDTYFLRRDELKTDKGRCRWDIAKKSIGTINVIFTFVCIGISIVVCQQLWAELAVIMMAEAV